jgi:hypothetical protein
MKRALNNQFFILYGKQTKHTKLKSNKKHTCDEDKLDFSGPELLDML